MNHLYYGDNLKVLRDSIADESVDLIYLDPPFNSNASYNVLFRSPTGDRSAAQIEAFDDTWHWGDEAEAAFQEVRRSGHTDAAGMLEAMRSFLGTNDMMAYLAMMAVRLVELHRVLKPTGSLYLHCDPTASHYLKILLDAVFGKRNFRREIIWRSGWVSGFKTAAKNWIRNHDTIFYYLKDERSDWVFNKQFTPHDKDYKRRGGGENTQGKAIDSVWDDPLLYSPNIKSFSTEKLGYPTQKPVTLLERILNASSNPGDTVLDPFCGCGTTIHAAQKLGRNWIGIDVTHLAIGLIEKRLRSFAGIAYKVIGVPEDIEGARRMFADDDPTKKEFEKWAVSLIGAQPWRAGKKGADGGIDGILPFGTTEKAIVSVKGGKDRQRNHIDQLKAVVDRERAQVGVFLTLEEPTKPMLAEAAAAGRYAAPGFEGTVPKIQIVTIEEAMRLRDRAVQVPLRRDDTFRKAPREEAPERQSKWEM